MLRAFGKDNNDCLSWLTEKTESPFTCPVCGKEVILKKGKIVRHHFAHKTRQDCPYGNNETEIHYEIKKSLYEYLQDKPNCKNCEIEKNYNTVRPDVFVNINSNGVAIEIQKSKIDVSLIMHRMYEYYKLGIAVLWVLPEKKPVTFIQETEIDKSFSKIYGFDTRCTFHRATTWEAFIHILFEGKIYYWQGDNTLKAYHFKPYQNKNDRYLQYEDDKIIDVNENILTKYGYRRYYSRYYRRVSTNGKKLYIEKDFSPLLRKETEYQNVKIPQCLIFVDKKKKWWIKDDS